MVTACEYQWYCNEASHDVLWWVPLVTVTGVITVIIAVMVIWHAAETLRWKHYRKQARR